MYPLSCLFDVTDVVRAHIFVSQQCSLLLTHRYLFLSSGTKMYATWSLDTLVL